MSGPDPGSVLLVGAHSDDVCWSIAGVVVDWSGPRQLVTVFSKAAFAWNRRHPRSESGQVTAVRRDEDRRFCAEVGTSYDGLDLEETALRGDDADLLAPTGDEDALVEPVRRRLEGLVGVYGCDRMLLPLGLGGHADHVVVRRAGILAAESTGIAPTFYEDLPYAIDLSLPEIAEAVERTVGRADPTLHRSSITIGEKRRLCELYASQFDERWWRGIAGHSARLAGGEHADPAEPVTERTWQAAS